MYNPRGTFPGPRPPRMNMRGMSPATMNMRGMSLPGMSLPGMSLPGMSLPGMNMPGLSLAGMNMSGMSPTAMINQGPYLGAGEINLPGMSQRMGLQGTPNRMMGPQGNIQRFGGTESFPRIGQQMQPQDSDMNMQGAQHRMDPQVLKEKMNMQEMQKLRANKNRSRWEPQASTSMSTSGGSMEMTKQVSTPQVIEQTSEVQSRYTTESASSILASFGLSNEDLEELSRYPDDQLTPENMPLILRDIRLRKMGNQISSADAKSRGRISEPLQSNVIDYGHGNKFGYNEDPVESRIYSPVTNLEARNEYHAIQSQPAISMETQSTMSCNQGVFPVEEIIRQMGFQNEELNAQSLFQVDSTSKMSSMFQTSRGNRKRMSESQTSTPSSHPIQVITPAAKPKRIQNESNIGNQPCIPMVSAPSIPMVSAPSIPMVSAPSIPMVSVPTLQMGPVMTQQNYQPIPEVPVQPVAVQPPMIQSPNMSTKFMKGNWVPVMSQSDAQKMKRLPTPSMMNDYYAASPRIFPHLCSLCNVECRHLKDWIQHQNTNKHIESCRQLRQQYPDWNPQVLATLRNEADKKENQTPRKRAGSSGSSPRRSRRSDSRHRVPRSRSRSPPIYGRARSKSRSPRRVSRRSPVRSRSPRRRSRSPRKSRSPHRSLSPRRARHLKSSPRYQRPVSTEQSLKRTGKSPEKKDSQAAVHSSASKVVTSSNKQESNQTKSLTQTAKTPTTVKNVAAKTTVSKMQSSTSKAKKPPAVRKPGPAGPTTVRKPGAAGPVTVRKPGAGPATVRKPGAAGPGTVRKPVNTSTNKPPVSSVPGKTSGQPAPKEVYNPLQRFKSKLSPGTIIHISVLPDDGYTDQDIIKIVQPFGKVSDILIIRSKNEAYLETNYKEAAVAAVKFSQTVPVLINRKRVKLRIAKQLKSAEQERKSKEDAQNKTKNETTAKTDKTGSSATSGKINGSKLEGKTSDSSKNTASTEKPAPTVKPDFSQPKGSGNQSEKTVEPVKKKKIKPVEEIPNSVVLVSNLPDKGYTVDEISNLAKPFGGVKDIIILSSHKKAYLQMASETSADSLVKFYACFPMSVAGSQLLVKLAPKFKNINDVEPIFTDLIAEAESKEQPDIHEQFVHIRNLPAEQYTEFQLVCMGLRFGKVDNYVVLKNKRKAILQLDSPKAAKTMVNFLKQYPVYMSDHKLKCTLSPKRKLLPGEKLTDDETDDESTGVVKRPDEKVLAKTADEKVVEPSTERKEATANISNIKTDGLSRKTEISKQSKSGGPSSITKLVDVEVVSVTKPAANELSTEKLEDSVKEKVIKDKSEVLLKESAVKSEEINALINISGEVKATVTKPEEELPHSAVPPVEVEGSMPKSKISLPNPDLKPVEGVADSVISAPGKLEGKPPDSKLEVQDSTQEKPESSLKETNKLQTQETSNPGKLASKVGQESHKSVMEKMPVNPEKGLPKRETKPGEKTREKNPENSVPDKHQKEELSQVKSETELATSMQTVADETKKVTTGDKASTIPQKLDTFSTKSVEQKSFSKFDTRKRSAPEKKPILRESGTPRPTSRRTSPTESSCNKSKQNISSISKRGSGRNSSYQEKDLRGDSRNTLKSQERENRPGTKKDDSNKNSAGRNTKSQRSSSGSSKPTELEEDELFPFDMDEFVTVDEVVDEPMEEKAEETVKIVSPPTRKNLPKRGKRKEPVKEENPSLEPSSKRSRGKETTPQTLKQEQSFVTLDEVGDEEDGAAAEADDVRIQAVTGSQPLVTKGEVLAEEAKISTVKDPRSLFTLDEISDEEDVVFQSTAKESCVSVEEEPEELGKGKPLVTLDEVGEVEEPVLSAKPSSLNTEGDIKQNVEEASSVVVPEEKVSTQTLENPCTVTTVHEESKDTDEQPLVTLDEVTEDEEESMADFSRLNFVTVDEVGGEEEEDEDDIKVSEETVPEETSEDKEKTVRKAELTRNETEGKSSSIEQQAEMHGRTKTAECDRS
ncbi:zinc finger protein 638 isoform X2 [Rhinatrema bivittatum]|nr:zinc finger protein 638 isoform X2 [Rhinatrema bivittatum]XP_029450309.1 zinc finger protein 638 isoform X2 [Rhinatrema bivittatum]XP_029450318.1 zinc finger protein 638 isoform X2 [Rhinatrema bivittatum]